MECAKLDLAAAIGARGQKEKRTQGRMAHPEAELDLAAAVGARREDKQRNRARVAYPEVKLNLAVAVRAAGHLLNELIDALHQRGLRLVLSHRLYPHAERVPLLHRHCAARWRPRSRRVARGLWRRLQPLAAAG